MPVVKAEGMHKKEITYRTVISRIWDIKAGVTTARWSRLDNVGSSKIRFWLSKIVTHGALPTPWAVPSVRGGDAESVGLVPKRGPGSNERSCPSNAGDALAGLLTSVYVP